MHRDHRLFQNSVLADDCRVGVLAEHWGVVIDVCYVSLNFY